MRANQSQREAGQQRGAALVYSLVVVLTIAVLMASLLQLSSGFSRERMSAAEVKQAFYTAEAGISEAYYGLTTGGTGRVGSEVQPARFSSGLFWVEATEIGEGLVRLESTGMAGRARAVLSAVVEKGYQSVASLGFFATDPLELPPGSILDGYDSRDGAPGEERLAVRVGSNGDVDVQGTEEAPSAIHGDVLPGPEHVVELDDHVTITGSTDPHFESIELPPIEVPETEIEPEIVVEENGILTMQPGVSAYESLEAKQGAFVLVEGPATVLLEKLTLKEDAKLELDARNGDILLYLTDQLDAKESSVVVTRAGDPSDVTLLLVGDGQIELGHGDSFTGVVYAPDGKIVLPAGMEVQGSLVGKELEFEGPIELHFDLYLVDHAKETVLPTLVSWRLLELDSAPGAPGSTPFTLLGVDPGTLSTPSNSHENVWIEIEYYDTNGDKHTYVGWELDFDWTIPDWVKKYTTWDAPGGNELTSLKFKSPY